MPRPRIPNRSTVILDRAQELILERGYDGTTMAEVAHRAGIGKGAIYREFPSKEALLDALLARSVRSMVHQVRAEVEGASEPVGISMAYRFGLEALLADQLMLAFYVADSHVLGSLLEEKGPARYGPRMEWLTSYLTDLQRLGLVRADIDPTTASVLLSAVSIGLITAASAIGPVSSDQLRAVVELLADTLQRAWEADARQSAVGPGREATARLLDRLDSLDSQLDKPFDGRLGGTS